MRTLIITALIIVLFFSIYKWSRSIIDKFGIDVKFKNVDLRGILSESKSAQVNLTASIVNKNNFKIPVKNFHINIFHNSILVAQTSSNGQDFIIPKNDSIIINHSLTMFINEASKNILMNIVANKPTEFTYKINATLYGFIPVSYTDKFIY
ncbi:MAG: hypothetical protein IT243_06040 [Bacteroidia bacterium]|nr:hypothetical protein [Bacteroidia bacterium]